MAVVQIRVSLSQDDCRIVKPHVIVQPGRRVRTKKL